MTLALVIGWSVSAVAVAAYLAGCGFMYPRLGGIFWPITMTMFLLAAHSQPGSTLRRVMGLDSGFQPVEIPGTDAGAASERIRYGQIETTERER